RPDREPHRRAAVGRRARDRRRIAARVRRQSASHHDREVGPLPPPLISTAGAIPVPTGMLRQACDVPEPVEDADDPGWPRGIDLLMVFVPYGTRFRLRSSKAGGLYTLRLVFLTFSATLVTIGVVVALISQPATSGPLPWLAVLAGAAVVSVVLTNVVEKPL